MVRVDKLRKTEDTKSFADKLKDDDYTNEFKYLENLRGASTDLAQRMARLESLQAAMA